MLKFNSTRLAAAAMIAIVGALGCSKDAHPQPAASLPIPLDSRANQPVAVVPRPQGDAVIIAPEVKAKCGIPESSDAPRFNYDSAVLGGAGIQTLDALATCLKDGAMRGETVLLVGRADPRGEDDYNMNLGGQRAEAVARHLRSKGVGGAAITQESRGESDARGVDEASWAADRRVDVTVNRPAS